MVDSSAGIGHHVPMKRPLAALALAAVLAGCGSEDAAVQMAATAATASETTVDQPNETETLAAVVAESTTTSSAPTETTIASPEPINDGQLHAESVGASNGAICAAVSLDTVKTRFCSPRADFTWSIGDRVFIFHAGFELHLQDGRVLVPEDGNAFVIHEIRDETVDNPINEQPNFCSITLIAEAFQRYAPGESFGWGGDGCMSEFLYGVGSIPGVDEVSFSEVVGGPEGSDRYVGFVGRLNGVWTVFELVPDDQFDGCENLSVPTAKEICTRSMAINQTAST